MEIPSQITVSIKPELLKSVLNMSAFQPGSTIRLKVLQLRGDRALIDFGNFRATADIKIPVTLGEELLVKVQETGKLLKLGLLKPERNNISTTDLVPRRFGNYFEDSFKGIQNETSLQKAFDSLTMTTLRKAIDVLLADITNQQGRAVKQLDSTEPFQVFTCALPLEEEKQAAKLKIYYQKKQKTESKKSFQISLLLSMDRLGELRTDFCLIDKDLAVTFFVKNQSTKTKIQEKYLDLQELLNPFFNQTLMRVIVSEKKIKDFDHEDVQTTSERKVDVRI